MEAINYLKVSLEKDESEVHKFEGLRERLEKWTGGENIYKTVILQVAHRARRAGIQEIAYISHLFNQPDADSWMSEFERQD